MVARASGTAPAPPADVGPTAAVRTGTLTLLRHGESEWNRAGRFTGWADIDLTAAGERQAARAGAALRAAGTPVDCCFSSALRRAGETARLALETMGRGEVRLEQTWRLNERHYGALQGLGPWRAIRRFGVLPVLRSRREYGYRPPPAEPDAALADPTTPTPRSESLADLRDRLAPCWYDQIAPLLARGRSVLVVSHKHALRALFAALTSHPRSPATLRVPTGVPIVLTLDRALALVARRALPLPPQT